MAREYARVKVTIWADADFRTLTPSAQHLYFLLLTSPTLTLAGIADWRPARLARMATGWTVDDIRAAADELTQHRYLVVDDDTDEVLVRSFIRHDGVLKSPNLTRAMVKSYAAAGSETVREALVIEVRRALEEDPDAKGAAEARALLKEPAANPSPNPSGPVRTLSTGFDNRSPIPHPTTNNPHPPPSPAPADVTRAPRPASPADAGGESDSPTFDTFWDLYPRKTGKGRARTAWLRATTDGTTPQQILDGLTRALPELTARDQQWQPHPGTWLTDERWDDDTTPPTTDPWAHLPHAGDDQP